jgi:predicted phosphodiesterase
LRILDIGDTHDPFHHPDRRNFLEKVAEKYKIGKVIHAGDVADNHATSRFVHDPQGRSAGDEADEAAESLRELHELFPSVDVCEGNHDRRWWDRGAEAGLPKRFFRPTNEILGLPKGWRWADSWEYDGVIFEHGDPFNSKNAHIQAAEANMQSTCIGHIHSHAGISYVGNRHHLVFGFNVGCLIDHKRYAFHYAKKAKAKPIIGCGIIIDGVPLFQPMPLGKGGRWTGRL